MEMSEKPSSQSLDAWVQIGERKRADLRASIPAEWIIPDDLLPPPPPPSDSKTKWERDQAVARFTETSGWFTPEELAITESDALSLVRQLAYGKLSSEVVTRAFCKRAAAAHQLINCLAETCFPRAIVTAQSLDRQLARTGSPIGPLHGLPISVKDNFNIAGLDSTVGFTSHVGDPAPSDAVLVSLLEAAGAVIYVKTNVPTAMMIAETVNRTVGRTLHPLDRRLTPGGSSGGEAALLLFRGSCLGVGTDIGGSLRIPAACTGVFTLRPSAGRFPTSRCRSGMPGQEAVQSVNGPLARSLDDLEFYCKTVVESQPWLIDPRCLPIPWRAESLALEKSRLKIGIMRHDDMVRPTPPVQRALETVTESLRRAGHQVVDWDAGKEHTEAVRLLLRMFTADGARAIKRELQRTGESMPEEMAAYNDRRELSAYENWQINLERNDLQVRYLERWNAAGLDAILCPTTPYSAVEHGKFRYVGFTGVFNVLDYSCVSFPTGLTVDSSVDVHTGTPEFLSPVDEKVHSDYNTNAVHGMPVSLQLVARRFEEEKVIAMTKVVIKSLH